MSVLVDCEILEAIESGAVVIDPFDRECLGTNSYDVHLGPSILVYQNELDRFYNPRPLDPYEMRGTNEFQIEPGGRVLEPGQLYLASTLEYTESHKHLPIVNGKSSLGRLGLSVHVTAGTGDVGFCNHWTLELTVVLPLRVYAGMPIAQLLWFTVDRMPSVSYGDKGSAKYAGRDPHPRPSEMWRTERKA